MRPPKSSLSFLDRFLTLWIFAAMAIGITVGNLFPSLAHILDTFKVQEISLPIALGLIWMMYPPLAEVKYEELSKLKGAGKVFSLSLIQNWVVGPVLMTVLAWVFLPDLPQYMVGLIMIGMARCIAMVLVWNQLAHGDNEYAAVLVALNSIFQIGLYAAYVYLFAVLLTPTVGLSSVASLNISPWDVAKSVLVFLGIPFFGGMLTRLFLVRRRGREWYDRFTQRIHPTSLIGLLFTVLVLFSLRAETMVQLPWHVVRIAVPLILYFVIMFLTTFLTSWAANLPYPETTTLSMTAASNNFELAIATAIGLFGIGSGQAFATVVGPLIEVPVMLGLVNVALFAEPRMFAKGLKHPSPELPSMEKIAPRPGSSTSSSSSEPKKVIFVCVGNAGRSQMAEAFASVYGRGFIKASSAGTRPAKGLDSLVVEAMKERGIDISMKKPKGVEEGALREADIVITMGCALGDACPLPLVKDAVDWGLEDPKGKSLERVREIRDEIERRVKELVEQLSTSER